MSEPAANDREHRESVTDLYEATLESESASAAQGRVGWSFSLRPGSWGLWFSRDRDGVFVWRLNVGPLHVVRLR